jgi:hypothetical protein
LAAAARRSYDGKASQLSRPPSRGAPSARNGGSKHRERYLNGTFTTLFRALFEEQCAVNNECQHFIIPYSSRISRMPSKETSWRTYTSSCSSSRAAGVLSANHSRRSSKTHIPSHDGGGVPNFLSHGIASPASTRSSSALRALLPPRGEPRSKTSPSRGKRKTGTQLVGKAID